MSLIVTTCYQLLVLALAVVKGQFVNDFDREVRFECPPNQILSFLGSIHHNHFEDRRWQFQCRPAPGPTSGCHWTGYLNAFEQPLLYACPGNEVLNGGMSYHDNHYEDRRFKVLCCCVPGKSTRHCYKTGFVNNWDSVMNFLVPDGYAIKGVYSVHDNHYEDRRFEFTVCNLA